MSQSLVGNQLTASTHITIPRPPAGILTAVAPNEAAGLRRAKGSRSAFQRTIIVPTRRSTQYSDDATTAEVNVNLDISDAVTIQDVPPSAHCEKENPPMARKYISQVLCHPLRPRHAGSIPSASRRAHSRSSDQDERNVISTKHSKRQVIHFDRDVDTAFARRSLPSVVHPDFGPANDLNQLLVRVTCSTWRRILRSHPDFVIDDVDPSLYGRAYAREAFRDPSLSFEWFVHVMLFYADVSEPLAPFIALYWLHLLAEQATRVAVVHRETGAKPAYPRARLSCFCFLREHRWLMGSRVLGTPISALTLDLRFQLRYFIAIFVMSQNVHGDADFSVRHVMKHVLNRMGVTIATAPSKPNFVPFDAASIGHIQWSVAAQLDFAMNVYGDDLVNVLAQYLSVDELAVVQRASVS